MKPKPDRCLATNSEHLCCRSIGHKGKHKCGAYVVDIPLRKCGYEWEAEKPKAKL